MSTFKTRLMFSISLLVFYSSIGVLCRKEAQTLEKKVHDLKVLSSRKATIKLNEDKFRQFVKSAPRNYSFIVMFTALSPHQQCAICRQAYDEFQLVANSLAYNQVSTDTLFFGMVDFDESPDVFSSLRLDSAPVFMHFPEKGKLKKADTMDIQRIGFQAEMIAKWINERTNIQIRVLRPPNYSSTLALALLFALMAALLYMKRDNLDVLFNRKLWGLFALGIVFFMTSGQMWNHIRGPPFMHRSPKGNGYIHGSSSYQFVTETYIVLIFNAAITLGMILMQEAVTSKGHTMLREIMAIVGLVLVLIFFSLLLSIFRMKAQGYPYRYEPFNEGPILYSAPSYWIEVEGIFPTVERGTTFYPHLIYYVPVYGYETPDNTVDYGYSLSADPAQYENDNMLYEHGSPEYYSAQSDEDFPLLATDTYHASEVPDFYLEPEASNVGTEDLQSSDADFSSSTIGSYHTEDRDSVKTSEKQIECKDFASKNLNSSVAENFESSLNSSYESSNDNKLFACNDSGGICKEMSSEATNVGTEDLQRSDAVFSSSTVGNYHSEDRDSELCSTGIVSNILKTSYKQIESNDFDSKNLNNSVEEIFESSSYESSNDNKLFACKDSGSICKEMSSDDTRLKEENNRVMKKYDCSSNCIYVSSKVNGNFVDHGSDEMSDEDIIVYHDDNIFEKKDLKDPLDNSESCCQSKFTASENSEDSCDELDYEDIMSSSISNTDDLQENTLRSFVFDETKLKNDITSRNGIKQCSGDRVRKNDIKKHCARSSSECESTNDYGEINYEYERFSMKTFEFDSESMKWENRGMKKFNTLGDLSDTKSIKEYNALEDLSKTRSLKKEEDSSISDDDEKTEVQLLENDIDYESVETRADEYGEKNCLSPPDCIELTDEQVKYLKDELYLTALSGKLYKKTHIPPVEILPIVYEVEEPLCEDDDESRTCYEEIKEELCEDNDESATIYEEVVEQLCEEIEEELCEDNHESATIYEEVEEQLCEDNEESLALQTSGVGEPEGSLTCSPDLSKSVKKQKSKGKRMKNIRKFFSRIFCCVKPP